MQVGVYRMSNERIGCSLADAAATPAYMNYLEAASASPPALHVVYINTSLETKAYAHELVPTITCTSSNVVQTILQVGIITSFFNYNLLHHLGLVYEFCIMWFLEPPLEGVVFLPPS